MVKFVKYVVRSGDLTLAAFNRLIDAVRYRRNKTDGKAKVVRVETCYDENGSEAAFEEPLID